MDVRIDCICPPIVKQDVQLPRHEYDTVTLPETLDFKTTLTIRQTIRFAVAGMDETMSVAEMTAVMAEAYLLLCPSAWTLVDEKGKPVPISRQAIRDNLLTHYEAAEVVGNAADELYSEKVVLPLLQGASSSSRSTPTPDAPDSTPPTSATTNGLTPRRRSKRSSTTTSPMVATGPMAASPGGGSSTSLN
jgi:hypothetical protein